MADGKPKEGVKTENNEHINLKVAGQDGSVVQFKIKRHTPLSKLMKAYCERQVRLGHNCNFFFISIFKCIAGHLKLIIHKQETTKLTFKNTWFLPNQKWGGGGGGYIWTSNKVNLPKNINLLNLLMLRICFCISDGLKYKGNANIC
uniref:Small ubiquitin-related modifier 2 n=1 Tax=Oreochromis niloticus TaxID=8128 RepID=A0A669BGF5_ORENI